MKHWSIVIPGALAGGFALLRNSRIREEHALDSLRQELERTEGASVFDPEMVESLPGVARRYLLHAIAPGTPIARSARLVMHGSFCLRPGSGPVRMRAEQVLAPPRGLIWTARIGSGFIWFEGFDRYGWGEGAMRWWLYGAVPLVRASGPGLTRSAAGRMAGESLLMPAALLPQAGADWEDIDECTARVRLRVGEDVITLSVMVDPDGRVQRASLMRWRDDAGNGRPGYVRFDIDEIQEERTFGGYTIPGRFRAGWKLGDPDEFPFFYAEIDSVTYL